MNVEPLDSIFNRNHTDKGSSGHNFAPCYERFIGHLRDRDFNLLEVGIQFGFSARSWLEAFPMASIYGVCGGDEHGIQDARFHFSKGNQRDAEFWSKWKHDNPRMYVIIDDAEHRADASKIMFDALWPHLHSGGIYIIEDTCTWFDPAFSSPLRGSDWIASLIADLNWNGKDYGGKPGLKQPYTLSGVESTLAEIYAIKHMVVLRKSG